MKPTLLFLTTSANPETTLQIEERDSAIHVYYPFHRNNRTATSYDSITQFAVEALELFDKFSCVQVAALSDATVLVQYFIQRERSLPGPQLPALLTALNKSATQKATGNTTLVTWSFDDPPPRAFPVYVKAPYSSFGLLGNNCASLEEFVTATNLAQKHLNAVNSPYHEMIKFLQEPQIDPVLTQPVLSYEAPQQGHQITVEGYQNTHTTTILAITDTLFFDSHKIDCFSLPSILTEKQVQAVSDKVSQDLRALGLELTFFNAEYWVSNTTVTLIEVNPRPARAFRNIYLLACGKDLDTVMADTLLHGTPPEPFSCTFNAIQANFFTDQIDSFTKLADLKKDFPSLKLTGLTAKNATLSEHGMVAAQIELVGDSFENIHNQVVSLRKTLGYNPES